MKRIIAVFAMVLGIAFATSSAMAQEGPNVGEGPGLFINLTTDDTWAAAKAISFGHQKALENGYRVAIWMNVRAVYLADERRPSHIHGLMAESGTSIQDMLAAFIEDGGTVLMCQACSAAAGLTLDDYIDGVEMGSWPTIEAWLFDPEVQTLSW
ncbi:DsrE family protein [Octadecabacter sp. 1_MG-2023]|uniref:DsrE family protein n=1 Tax=unclassified Octadecabacter TaxID=196158 RepID=UPI001C0917B2|nr:MULTISPECIES: DsrE family protein [unclassified Octadecabacter]MBU2993482.1 DsrE family protein [Octadecabacter sp. B2R22]MDO6733062.1 DsrE family protein [Octadecabacter sp. 1_MG-2023]